MGMKNDERQSKGSPWKKGPLSPEKGAGDSVILYFDGFV